MLIVKSQPMHPHISVFEPVRPFNHGMMPSKFCDIFHGSRVIRSANIQMDTTEKQYHLCIVMYGW